MNSKFLFLISVILIAATRVEAQDACGSAGSLCAGSTRNATTVASSTVGSDPALSCGDGIVTNSVWFTILAINNGNCTVTITNINNAPGLSMEIYTGACGALIPIGQCASGIGSINVSFATVAGTTYFVMVDGESGNQETFDITATTVDNAIVARPDADFDVNPASGCTPLVVFMDSTTTLHGGSNITWEWRINGGGWTSASGMDTTMTFSVVDTHEVTLRVCNQQCGCKSISQDIIVQDLFSSISMSPPVSCIGTTITFDGSDTILPPPSIDPNTTDWEWDFGDPASGPLNTDHGQSVTHIFNGPGLNYTVRLIVQATCGPDTVYTSVNLLPKPTVEIIGPDEECEGIDINLQSNITNATPPITYDWIGAGSFTCTNCPTTDMSGLPVGGPYAVQLSIVDSLGCVADTSKDVNINENPTVFAGGFITVCPSDSAQLEATPSGGTPPYSYLWSPSAGILPIDTIYNPYTFNTAGTSYCVDVTDSKGCISTSDCVNINQWPIPVVNSSSIDLCTSQSNLDNTFTVAGANPGSTFSWALSADYGLISAAAPDSSDVTATFPPVVGTYSFTVIVTDGITGCIDTITTSFDVVNGLNVSLSGPSVLCVGDSAALTVSGATTYSWTASPAYVFADSTAPAQTVSPVVTTVFTIVGTTGTCDQTVVHTLTVSAKPVALINPLAPYCGCDTIALNGVGSTPAMTYQWLSQNGGGITSPGSLTTTAYLCGIDSVFLIVTDPVTSCADTASDVTTFNPNPDAVIDVVPSLICNGTVTLITLDATGSNADPGTVYDWSSSDASVIITDTTAYPSTTANVSAQTVFYLTVTDLAGCDSTVSDTVNVHPMPSISADFPFLCSSDPLLETTITISGASGGSSYTWDTIPACAVPNTASSASQLFDLTACPDSAYNFSVTVNDPVTTCTTILNQTITVIPGVNLVVSNDTSFCEGGVATLFASGANTYSWSSGQTTDTIVVSGLAAAGSPYVFIVNGTVGNCSDIETLTVTVNPVPATSPICCDSTTCQSDPASNYFVTPPSANTYLWTVNLGNILIGQNTPNVIVAWDDTTNLSIIRNITVLETTPLGCSAFRSLDITVNPLPDTPIVSGPDTVCGNSLATYFVSPTTAGSTYTWSINGGTFTAGNTGAVNTFLWGNTNPAFIDVFETTSAGCSGASLHFPVYIDPQPSPVAVSGNSLVCDNMTELYYVSANPGSTYTWTVTNNLFDTVNAATDTLTVDWGMAGTGQVSVFETNAGGCNSVTTDVPITINGHPTTIVLNTTDTLCNNDPFQIIANAVAPTIRWYTDGTGTFSDTTIASAIYYPSATDTGFINLTMVASNPPCQNDTGRVLLYLLPAPVVSIIGPPAPICYGTIDTLFGFGGGSYIWTPGGIPFATIGVRPLVTTTYTLAVTNAFNCTSYDSITVNVLPPGIPDGGLDQTICAGNVVTLTGSQQNAGGLLWSTSGDGIFLPDTTSPNVTYVPGVSDTTTNSVMIFLETTGACYNLTDTVNVTIEHPPFVNAGADTTISSEPSANSSVELSPTVINVTGLLWTTSGSGTFDPSDTSINATYNPSAADYELESIIIIATTTGSCTPAIDTIIVDFSPFVIPNVFTPYPMSPGFNDYFEIRYITPNTTLKIWDRWGTLVYTSNYYQNDWDAHGLKADTYYYMVVAEEKQYKGWVQILRE